MAFSLVTIHARVLFQEETLSDNSPLLFKPQFKWQRAYLDGKAVWNERAGDARNRQCDESHVTNGVHSKNSRDDFTSTRPTKLKNETNVVEVSTKKK